MLCQNCQKNEANVHVYKTMNGKMEEKYLCEECAKSSQEFNINIQPGLIVSDFLQALFGFTSPAGNPAPAAMLAQEQACPQCGMTLNQISRSGKLGCSLCHDHFIQHLAPLFRRIHGGGQHVGKIPRRSGVKIKEKVELKRLKDLLQQHIVKEEFEMAAAVRDQIRLLEQKQEGDLHGA